MEEIKPVVTKKKKEFEKRDFWSAIDIFKHLDLKDSRVRNEHNQLWIE